MRRIGLCLLILLACADVAAREVRLSSPDSTAGVDAAPVVKVEARKPVAPREAAAAREVHVRPSVHGDVGTRMRWHSFLPGMFR